MQGLGLVADQLRRSTVSILSKGQGSGSGVVWHASGLIVTNAHVVRGKNATVELWTGRRFPAQLVAQDIRRDLATLRMEAHAELVPASAADAANLRAGELVVAVGNPLGFQGAVSQGVVHGVGPVRGLGGQTWVQADIRLAPGNSGGPLADAQGRVVGVNAMISSGLGLAIPSEAVRRFVELGHRGVTLGVAVQPAQLRLNGKPAAGLVVVDVTDGSPAAQASLMLGDVIVGVNERELASCDDLREVIASGLPQLTLRFLRGERNRSRQVTVRLRRAEAA